MRTLGADGAIKAKTHDLVDRDFRLARAKSCRTLPKRVVNYDST